MVEGLPLPPRLSPLAGYFPASAQEIQTSKVSLGLRRNMAVVEIMGWPASEDKIKAALSKICGPAPSAIAKSAFANTGSNAARMAVLGPSGKGKLAILPNGPCHYLVTGEDAPQLFNDLRAALPADTALIANQSHGRSVFRLSGSHVREILSLGSLMDMSINHMPKGAVAPTSFHHVPCIIHMVDNERADLYVPRSFALHVYEAVKKGIYGLS